MDRIGAVDGATSRRRSRLGSRAVRVARAGASSVGLAERDAESTGRRCRRGRPRSRTTTRSSCRRSPARGSSRASPIDDIAGYLNETALFRNQWQYRPEKTARTTTRSRRRIRPMLRDELAKAKADDLLQPAVVYGYFPASGDGNDLVIWDGRVHATSEITRFRFPRQTKAPFLCIADFFRPIETSEVDYVAFHIVTMGPAVSEATAKLFADDRYQDYLHLHGLGVEMAEALAEYWHHRIREEWGFADEDGPTLAGLFRQQYRGGRYSWGYPACPDLEDNVKVLELLDGERIGLECSEETGYQYQPEQTTSAIICHHPKAKYFVARWRRTAPRHRRWASCHRADDRRPKRRTDGRRSGLRLAAPPPARRLALPIRDPHERRGGERQGDERPAGAGLTAQGRAGRARSRRTRRPRPSPARWPAVPIPSRTAWRETSTATRSSHLGLRRRLAPIAARLPGGRTVGTSSVPSLIASACHVRRRAGAHNRRMGFLLVVTGPPGAGKSTVSRRLADAFDPSVLVEGDAFFGFLATGAIQPWLPESDLQNEIVTEAAASCAGRFASDYATLYDGVVGPWFLPTFAEHPASRRSSMSMLLPPVERCLDGVRTRLDHVFSDEDATRKMHQEFADAASVTAMCWSIHRRASTRWRTDPRQA